MEITEPLVGLVAVVLFSLPLMLVSARFALRPFVEALRDYLKDRQGLQQLDQLQRRVAFLESQLGARDGVQNVLPPSAPARLENR